LTQLNSFTRAQPPTSLQGHRIFHILTQLNKTTPASLAYFQWPSLGSAYWIKNL